MIKIINKCHLESGLIKKLNTKLGNFNNDINYTFIYFIFYLYEELK